ncbi:unnamed protein product [Zymoseptoria tritici ST99CH_1A5]|uniref:Uncharacterized protein n=1 Tax=Zymoseptoria tritici ST99CH_1A5 TaxID=1276529 RepID=A0A1Y6M407_ZYMTR|nr:unnamed protein product [Zymoseptoria tritici ST99CH_1A5]
MAPKKAVGRPKSQQGQLIKNYWAIMCLVGIAIQLALLWVAYSVKATLGDFGNSRSLRRASPCVFGGCEICRYDLQEMDMEERVVGVA